MRLPLVGDFADVLEPGLSGAMERNAAVGRRVAGIAAERLPRHDRAGRVAANPVLTVTSRSMDATLRRIEATTDDVQHFGGIVSGWQRLVGSASA